MANANAIRAGRAFVELFADDSKLRKTLDGWKAKLNGFGDQLNSIGTNFVATGVGGATALLGTTAVFASMGDDLTKMSERTGASVEALSALGYAAAQSGTDLATVEVGMRKMQKTIVAAAGGNKKAAESLDLLGLSAEDLFKLNPDEQFVAIAQRISQIEDPAQRATAALDLFGRQGTQLLPLFKDGSKGITALMQRAEGLGLIISTADAQRATEYGDAMDDLGKVAKQVVFTLGAALAPTIQEIAGVVMTNVRAVTTWINSNRNVVKTVFAVTAGVAATGAGLIALGVGAKIAALGIGTVSMALGIVGAVAAFALSPIGLLTAGLVAAGVASGYFADVSGKAAAWVSENFSEMKSETLATLNAIGDALRSGELGLAAEIAWVGIQYAFKAGWGAIMNWWDGAVEQFNLVLWDIGADFAKIWAGVKMVTLATFVEIADGITQALVKAFNYVSGLAIKTFATLARAAVWINQIAQTPEQSEKDLAAVNKWEAETLGSINSPNLVQNDFAAKVHEGRKKIVQDAVAEYRQTVKDIDDALQKESDAGVDRVAAAVEERKAAMGQLLSKLEDLRWKADLQSGINGVADALNFAEKTTPAFATPKFEQQLDQMSKGMEWFMKSTDARGTFSSVEASRAFNAGQESDVRQLIEYSRQTAKNTEKTVDRLDKMDDDGIGD